MHLTKLVSRHFARLSEEAGWLSVLSHAGFNPFAKSAQSVARVNSSSSSGPANPFANKKNGAPNATSLKKTGSFFDRVDASNGLSATTYVAPIALSGAVKQSTLFGLPAASGDAGLKKLNQGRKRKSDSSPHIEESGGQGAVIPALGRKEAKKLDSFFRGEVTKTFLSEKGQINDEGEKFEPGSGKDAAAKEDSQSFAEDQEPDLDRLAREGDRISSLIAADLSAVNQFTHEDKDASLTLAGGEAAKAGDGTSRLAAFRFEPVVSA